MSSSEESAGTHVSSSGETDEAGMKVVQQQQARGGGLLKKYLEVRKQKVQQGGEQQAKARAQRICGAAEDTTGQTIFEQSDGNSIIKYKKKKKKTVGTTVQMEEGGTMEDEEADDESEDSLWGAMSVTRKAGDEAEMTTSQYEQWEALNESSSSEEGVEGRRQRRLEVRRVVRTREEMDDEDEQEEGECFSAEVTVEQRVWHEPTVDEAEGADECLSAEGAKGQEVKLAGDERSVEAALVEDASEGGWTMDMAARAGFRSTAVGWLQAEMAGVKTERGGGEDAATKASVVDAENETLGALLARKLAEAAPGSVAAAAKGRTAWAVRKMAAVAVLKRKREQMVEGKASAGTVAATRKTGSKGVPSRERGKVKARRSIKQKEEQEEEEALQVITKAVKCNDSKGAQVGTATKGWSRGGRWFHAMVGGVMTRKLVAAGAQAPAEYARGREKGSARKTKGAEARETGAEAFMKQLQTFAGKEGEPRSRLSGRKSTQTGSRWWHKQVAEGRVEKKQVLAGQEPPAGFVMGLPKGYSKKAGVVGGAQGVGEMRVEAAEDESTGQRMTGTRSCTMAELQARSQRLLRARKWRRQGGEGA
jgi:hypothetical protein